MIDSSKDLAEAILNFVNNESELYDLTTDQIFEASQTLVRNDIYAKYPSADPKVIEGLLLNLKNTYYGFLKEYIPTVDPDTKIAEWKTTEAEDEILKNLQGIMILLTLGMKKTIKQLYQ
jgi:hypothetical protein